MAAQLDLFAEPAPTPARAPARLAHVPPELELDQDVPPPYRPDLTPIDPAHDPTDADSCAWEAEQAESLLRTDLDALDVDQLGDLAHALDSWAHENRLTLVSRTLRDAQRYAQCAAESAATIDPTEPRARLVHAITYARRELTGDYDHAHHERPTLTDLDQLHRDTDALDAANRDAVTQWWLDDPAGWLLGTVLAPYAQRLAADDGTAEWLARGTHGGGGTGYAYQCDGGGITIATSYADTHTSAAAAGPVRRVTWATLRKRAADPILF